MSDENFRKWPFHSEEGHFLENLSKNNKYMGKFRLCITFLSIELSDPIHVFKERLTVGNR